MVCSSVISVMCAKASHIHKLSSALRRAYSFGEGEFTVLTRYMEQCLPPVVEMSGFTLFVILTRHKLVAFSGVYMLVKQLALFPGTFEM